jgi:hypothetical protein
MERYLTMTEDRASAFRARVEEMEIDPALIDADELVLS